MAGELNAAVIACSQMSRMVENRPSHRPQLSDLRDSGSIEQDADIVAFIHREDVYITEDEWESDAPGAGVPTPHGRDHRGQELEGAHRAASGSSSGITWSGSTPRPGPTHA